MPVLHRRIKVERVMGTVVAIDVRDSHVPEPSIQAAFTWLHEVDQRFSTYKPESEISRLGRGDLTLEECHADVAAVLRLCEELRARSDGAFNAWRARVDGRLDPSGVVKGWAVEHAAKLLEHAGAGNFAINAGGDIVLRGAPEVGRRWRVGIRHPDDATAVAVVLEVTNLSVATSGTYERGEHILDPRTGEPARGLRSLTVAGPSLLLADAYATAGFAMGAEGVGWAARQPGYCAYGITNQGRACYDNRLAEMIAA